MMVPYLVGTRPAGRESLPRVSRPPISGAVVSGLLCAIPLIVLLLTRDEMLALGAVAVLAFGAFLLLAPPLWLAILLIVLIPFQSLITQLLGGFDSNTRQVFALWKEALIGIGTIRAFLHNPDRRKILDSNRWVLVFSGTLVLVYCVTLLRIPSVPALFSFDLETRIVGIMLFFMFLGLSEKHISILLRLMLWSVGSLALYGIIQYFWDYEGLLFLIHQTPSSLGLDADGTRRLYSYSLNSLEPAYAAMIAILILLSGAFGSTVRIVLPWLVLLVSCLLLTYTRSGYIGLLVGLLALALVKHVEFRHYAVVSSFALCIACIFLLLGGSPANSDIVRRLQSIFTQSDQSSMDHKAGMQRAVQVISDHPFGIGLGNYGTVQQRFSRDDEGYDIGVKTENWILQVGVQNGFVGAGAYTVLTVVILVSLLRRRPRRIGNVTISRAAAGAVFLAMTVAGIMIPVWDLTLPSVYAWALVGMAQGRISADPRAVIRASRILVGKAATAEHLLAGRHEQVRKLWAPLVAKSES